jgi:hypothetical protein
MKTGVWVVPTAQLDALGKRKISCPLPDSIFIFSYAYPFIPLVCAECDSSLLFSGASSIPLCYVIFPAILLHQLFFHPPHFILPSVSCSTSQSRSSQLHI